jgi:hypothetical protein
MMHPTDGTEAGSDSGGNMGDAPPPGWTNLISRSWSLSFGGDEGYRCRRIKTTEDMDVSAFRADMGPNGTHHLFLTLDPNGGTMTGNVDSCNQDYGVDNGQLLYGASVGPTNAQDLVFPAGIAVHIPAGSYIVLNAHVYDATDNPMNGSTGVLVQTVPPGEVQHEVDAVFVGTQSIDIPSNGMQTQVTSTCPAPRSQDYHILAVWPHMHQFGTHAHLVNTNPQNVHDVIVDKPFTFDDQTNSMITERVLHTDDNLQFTCTYMVPSQTCTYPGGQCNNGTCQNDGLCHVPYGESSVGEMCYAALYKWPTGGDPYGCVTSHNPI